MGKRGPKPQKRISTDWSPVLAYVVGLIASDGCLSKDGRHIDFTSKDRDLVITFQECLGLHSVKIGTKSRGYGDTRYPHIQFGDVLFYQWLVSIGLTPKKSRTIGPLKIPRQYFFDFLRGCFDGDGCFYSYWDKRWRSSFMFYISFTSASRLFLVWLQSQIRDQLRTTGHITASNNAYQLKFAKHDSLLLIDQFYGSPDIPHLARKRLKIEGVFSRIDQN